MEKQAFPLQDVIPPQIKEFLLDFWWDLDKLHALELPEMRRHMDEFMPYLDLPFWQHDGKPFQVTPREVLRYPDKYHEQYIRTLNADLQYPIIIFQRQGRPTVVLDGVHRLLKAHLLGKTGIQVKQFSDEHVPLILHTR